MGLYKFISAKNMELTREYFRAIILHNFKCGLSIQDCIDTLYSFYGKETLSYSTMKNWCKKFQRWPVSFQDEFREGRPMSIVQGVHANELRVHANESVPQNIDVVPQNIDAARELI